LLLITHDLGIVARMAQRVSVMYAGEVVESAPVEALFAAPTHPYTRGLLACIPVPGGVSRDEPLGSIPGVVPRIAPGFAGCAFRDRCAHATEECATRILSREAGEGRVRVTRAARSTLTLSSPTGGGRGFSHTYLCRLPPEWPRAEAA
jgi:peptide/nickel transport system ATP-binding protein